MSARVRGGATANAIRTRLPTKADTVALGQDSRDASDALRKLVPLQLVDVNNQLYIPGKFNVVMPLQPKMVLCTLRSPTAPDVTPINAGGAVAFTWLGGQFRVDNILNAVSGTFYDMVFLGVG